MRIAVLYDGDGKIRAALEAEGHDCVGFEPRLDKYQRGRATGSGRVVNTDPKKVDLSAYDRVVVNRRKIPKWVDHESVTSSTTTDTSNDAVVAKPAS